jgi:hypothetical protein
MAAHSLSGPSRGTNVENRKTDGVRTEHPETPGMKGLMLAVLEDALRCLQTYVESRNPAHRLAFGEAETWILERRTQGPFTFVSICEVLGAMSDSLLILSSGSIVI